MLVENIMNRRMLTINPSTTIQEAFEMVKTHHVHHIPVKEKEALVGLITARHLRQNCLSSQENNNLSSKTVAQIMKTDVVTAHPLDFIEDIALTMYQQKIGCLPVIQYGKLVGLVTERDIMRTLIEMTGISHPSSQIEIEAEDRIGVLADISQIFKENKLNISSAFIYPSKNKGKKMIVFRVRTIDPRNVVTKINEAGHHVIWPKQPEE